jgi:hypothetical protein
VLRTRPCLMMHGPTTQVHKCLAYITRRPQRQNSREVELSEDAASHLEQILCTSGTYVLIPRILLYLLSRILLLIISQKQYLTDGDTPTFR